MYTVWQDLRYGARMMSKQPGFTLIAALTLSLGIGANTAIFSVVNAVLLRPLPYPDPARLMEIGQSGTGGDDGSVGEPKFLFWRDQNQTFEAMALYQPIGSGVNLASGNDAEYVSALKVSLDFFRALGVAPSLGRGFTREEDQPGGERVAIVSDGLWRRRFGAEGGLIGRSVAINGANYTVVGVLPPGFQFLPDADVFTPLRPSLEGDSDPNYGAIGRLKPGGAETQAQADLKLVAEKYRAAFPRRMRPNESAAAVSLQRSQTADVRSLLWLLLGAVSFVLLIACANVANLQLTRAAARQKEMAVRKALGASRARIARQLITEGVLLALVGGAAGLLLAVWGVDGLTRLIPEGALPYLSEITLDWRVLAFALAASLATGLVFGLAPAFQMARVDVNRALKEGTSRGTTAAAQGRLRGGLVVAEVALSLLLLIGAALMIQTFVNLRRVAPGFDPRNVLTFQISPSGPNYDTTAKTSDFYRRALERIKGLPGVESAAVTSNLPLSAQFRMPFAVEGQPPRPESVQLRLITPEYFRALRIPLRQGREFAETDAAGTGNVAVVNEAFARQYISNADPLNQQLQIGRGQRSPKHVIVGVVGHEIWERSFGGDPGIIGRTVTLNKMPFTVVGVAPPEFNGTMTGLVTEAWVPMMMYERIRPGLSRDMFEHRGNHWLDGIARIKPGVSPAQARAELETISAQLAREYPDTNKDKILRLQSLSRLGAGQLLTPVLSIVMALVGVLLLIVCANVANLLLARAAGRRKEISVRLAIGAGRARIVRQLLTESLLLALAGGACGFLVALWSAGLLKAVFPPVDGKLIDLAPDAQALGFTFLLSLVTTVVFGLVPALQSSRLDLVSTLKEETAGGARRRGRLRRSLVIAQVAMALLLLLCAGLFMRGVQKAQSVNPGFNSQNVLLASVDLFPNGYNEESGANFFRQALARLAAIPGAQSVSLARRIPLGIEGVSDRNLEIEGFQPPKGEEAWAFYNSVGPDYFRTLEVPLVSGREFTAHDGRDAMKVAVVNQTFVNRYLPNQNAVGRRIRAGADWITIIGVARDFKYKQLDERPSPYLFLPVYQAHRPDMTFLVRTSGPPTMVRSSVQETLRSIDPSLPVFAIRTLEASTGAALIAQRTGSMLLGLFGIVALFLSATGLYGVLAYSVSERQREIGIRIALGASAGDMVKLVIGQGVKLIMLGTAIGLLAALGVTRLITSLIFGVSPTDPLTFVGVAVLLVMFALLACYIPARRAAKVDPMVALRCE